MTYPENIVTLSNFEQEVAPHILERGRAYWQEGRVQNLRINDDEEIIAEVRGSSLYRVEIALDDNRIEDVYCNCPYEQSDYCKHVAAVLLAVKEEGIPELTASPLNGILEAMTPEDLRDLVKEIVQHEPYWRDRIIARTATEADDVYQQYFSLINNRFEDYTDSYGFVGYHEAAAIGNIAENILSEIDRLILDDEYDQALAIGRALLTNLVDIIEEADDSNGYIGGAVEDTIKRLGTLARNAELPREINRKVFDALTDEKLLNKASDYDWHYDLLRIAVELADGKQREERLFGAAQQMIDGSRNGWGQRYNQGQYWKLRRRYLEKFVGPEAADEFVHEHIEYSDFREIVLQQLYEKADYEDLIHCAHEGVKQDADWVGLVNQWRNWILKGAEAAGDLPLQREILRQLDQTANDLTYYKKLKATYPSPCWMKIREDILTKASENYHRTMKILIEEKLYDRLWVCVNEHLSLNLLASVDIYLLPRYINEIHEHYHRLVHKTLSHAQGRKHYAEVAGLLAVRMDRLGSRYCFDLAESVLLKYPNRPAMRDEFQKAGLI